jgi:hypothetical protein
VCELLSSVAAFGCGRKHFDNQYRVDNRVGVITDTTFWPADDERVGVGASVCRFDAQSCVGSVDDTRVRLECGSKEGPDGHCQTAVLGRASLHGPDGTPQKLMPFTVGALEFEILGIAVERVLHVESVSLFASLERAQLALRLMKWPSRVVFLSVFSFVALSVTSMRLYPGGSWLELTADGHELWRNFLCDVLNETSINGQSNEAGAWAMRAAMVTLLPGVATTWWHLPRLIGPSRLARGAQFSGVLATALSASVPFTPPANSHSLHTLAIVVSGVPMLFAFGCALGALKGAGRKQLLVVGWLAAGASGVGLALYLREAVFGAPMSMVLPLSHRIATALVLGWLALMGWSLRVSLVPGPERH